MINPTLIINLYHFWWICFSWFMTWMPSLGTVTSNVLSWDHAILLCILHTAKLSWGSCLDIPYQVSMSQTDCLWDQLPSRGCSCNILMQQKMFHAYFLEWRKDAVGNGKSCTHSSNKGQITPQHWNKSEPCSTATQYLTVRTISIKLQQLQRIHQTQSAKPGCSHQKSSKYSTIAEDIKQDSFAQHNPASHGKTQSADFN